MYQSYAEVWHHIPFAQYLMILAEGSRYVIHDVTVNTLERARLHITIYELQPLERSSDTHCRRYPFSCRDIQQWLRTIKEVTMTYGTSCKSRYATLYADKPVGIPATSRKYVIKISYRYGNNLFLAKIRLFIIHYRSCLNLPCCKGDCC